MSIPLRTLPTRRLSAVTAVKHHRSCSPDIRIVAVSATSLTATTRPATSPDFSRTVIASVSNRILLVQPARNVLLVMKLGLGAANRATTLFIAMEMQLQ